MLQEGRRPPWDRRRPAGLEVQRTALLEPRASPPSVDDLRAESACADNAGGTPAVPGVTPWSFSRGTSFRTSTSSARAIPSRTSRSPRKGLCRWDFWSTGALAQSSSRSPGAKRSRSPREKRWPSSRPARRTRAGFSASATRTPAATSIRKAIPSASASRTASLIRGSATRVEKARRAASSQSLPADRQ